MEIEKYSCTHCGVSAVPLAAGRYVINDEGEHIPLRHPGEVATLNRVLGYDYDDKKRDERLVCYNPMDCAACKAHFKLDLKREEHKCPECGSEDIHRLTSYIDKTCPICKEEVIKRTVVGMM